ncbi:MAG: LytR/AlgR family response regulator transcription factor [Salibacteraceae bacterium]
MKALIVDDEPLFSSHLQELLQSHCPQVEVVRVFQNPKEALVYLRKETADALFLDIEMPEMNAFEFIEIIGMDRLPPIVFTTSYSKYAVQAFKVQALDYLLKPIVADELLAAVERLSERSQTEHQANLDSLLQDLPQGFDDRLVLASGQYYHFADPEEIIRVEGNGSYSNFFLTGDRQITTSRNLKTYVERLENRGFLRTHQSHLVNPEYLQGFDKADGGELVLREAQRVPVSKRLKKQILDFLRLR